MRVHPRLNIVPLKRTTTSPCLSDVSWNIKRSAVSENHQCPEYIICASAASTRARVTFSTKQGLNGSFEHYPQYPLRSWFLKELRLLLTFWVNPGDFNRRTSNLNKSVPTDCAVKPFSLISNTLEGQDTLWLVLFNNTATQSRHIIAVHSLHCSSPALLFHLKGCTTFSHSRTDTKSRRFSKGPLWSPVKLFN